jgi:hypothetical protein
MVQGACAERTAEPWPRAAHQACVVPQRGQPTVVETDARNACPQPQR